MNRLRLDEHGGAGLSLAFIIVGVIVVLTFTMAMFTATTISNARQGLQDLSSNSRTAVTLMEAELNGKGAAALIADLNAQGEDYVPGSAESLNPREIRFTKAVMDGTSILVTAVVDSPKNPGPAREVTTLYTPEGMVSNNDEWEPALPGDRGIVNLWRAQRTVPEGVTP